MVTKMQDIVVKHCIYIAWLNIAKLKNRGKSKCKLYVPRLLTEEEKSLFTNKGYKIHRNKNHNKIVNYTIEW